MHCTVQEFHKLMAKAKAGKDHDDIFDQLKAAVVETAMGRHLWEDKAAEMLRVSSRADRLDIQPLELTLERLFLR